MKKSLLFKIVVIVLAFVGSISAVNAQVTTSAMNGTVKDAKGALPGASVKAIHVPTGTVYSVSTNNDGRFSIANMRPGGPYTIEVNYVGFQKESATDIYLKLGDPYTLNVVLSDDSKNLEEVVVSGKKDATMNSKRTGAATTISKEQIQNLPTLSRSLQDFTRLTPQANGNSFSGSSTRYNSINIDGAMNNDIFGIAGSPSTGWFSQNSAYFT
ncbi:carboxypeptidase regulatory-like domain-containing protein [Pedobacter panaciterrae]